MDFDHFLANDTHDWLSTPHTVHGWRVSGRRRVHGCDPADIYHAGIDFLAYYCAYLEPALGFRLDGVQPAQGDIQWTPSSLAITYTHGDWQLKLTSVMPAEDALLVDVSLTNKGGSEATVALQAYGEAERHRDPEAINGKPGWGKDIHHAEPRRLGSRTVVTDICSQIGASHRGGITDYTLVPELKWRHAFIRNSVFVQLPADGQADDTDDGWAQSWHLTVPAGESVSLTFSLANRYLGKEKPTEGNLIDLQHIAAATSDLDFAQTAELASEEWNELLAAAPEPDAAIPEHLRQLYYRAWACIWQLVTPGFDTGRPQNLIFRDASLLVTKADHRATFPAEFETLLGAAVIAQVDPHLAAQITDSVLDATEADGFVPEVLVFTKDHMLGFYTSYIVWDIYRRTGDREWLASTWEPMTRSILCHYRRLSFAIRRDPFIRNIVFVHIGYMYMVKIAEELSLTHDVVNEMRWMVDETFQVVQSFWDDDKKHFVDYYCDHPSYENRGFQPGSSVQSMVALFAGATDDQIPHLLHDLREHYMIGGYYPTETPDETDLSKCSGYKHSNYIYFLPGLAKHDPELCREIALSNLEGIYHNGDFHEQIKVDGDRKAFGPMSVFGAYACVLCTQMLGRLGMPDKEQDRK